MVPCFFCLYSDVSFYTLFVYIIVSSVSSFLLLLGIVKVELVGLFLLGLIVKFGLFPFMGWVYTIVLGSNGLVVWLFSVFLKFPFVYVCFFLRGYSLGGLCGLKLLVFFTFFVLSVLFWLYKYS